MRFLSILVIITIIAIAINKFFFSEEKININQKNIKVKQEQIYNQIGNPYFADVGVALSVNIGMNFNDQNKNTDKIYENVMDIEYIINHKEIARDQIIKTNIELLNEYITLLQVDIMDLLSKSVNRAEVFDSYVSQLVYRGNFIKKHISVLEKQKINLIRTEKEQASTLTRLKENIRNSLKELNQFGATQNLDEYLELREKYTQTRIYLYFVTKFIDNYKNLQKYNHNLIIELRESRNFIIKGEALHIPKGDTSILKKYGLLIEDDYFNLAK